MSKTSMHVARSFAKQYVEHAVAPFQTQEPGIVEDPSTCAVS